MASTRARSWRKSASARTRSPPSRRTAPSSRLEHRPFVTTTPRRQRRKPHEEREMPFTSKVTVALAAGATALFGAGAADAAWQPTKTIEFIATAGPGGGTDNL